MKTWLLGLGFSSCVFVYAACPSFPAAYDVQTLEYPLEKIGSSLRVVLDFPRFSTHPTCESKAVSFGTLWEMEVASSAPILVRVYDRLKNLVQQYQLIGTLGLKVTANRATVLFFSLDSDKKILDHRLVSAELWNDSPLASLPYFEVVDCDKSRRLSGSFATWK